MATCASSLSKAGKRRSPAKTTFPGEGATPASQVSIRCANSSRSSLADLRFALRQLRRAPRIFHHCHPRAGARDRCQRYRLCLCERSADQAAPLSGPGSSGGPFWQHPILPRNAACPTLTTGIGPRQTPCSAPSRSGNQPPSLLHHPNSVEALRTGLVSGGFFATLGVTPAMGRLFTPADDTPAASLTVVLPYATWQRSFGGRDDILGQSIRLNDDTYTVIGCTSTRVSIRSPRAAELWVTVHGQDDCGRDRSCRQFSAFASAQGWRFCHRSDGKYDRRRRPAREAVSTVEPGPGRIRSNHSRNRLLEKFNPYSCCCSQAPRFCCSLPA